MTIEDAIYRGFKAEARQCTQELLLKMGEVRLVNERLIPALDVVGAEFEAGKLFLPQLRRRPRRPRPLLRWSSSPSPPRAVLR